jgi:hypothetical protein
MLSGDAVRALSSTEANAGRPRKKKDHHDHATSPLHYSELLLRSYPLHSRGTPTNRCSIEVALDSLKRNLKDYLFNTGRRNIKLLDPMIDLRVMRDDEIWQVSNPVHPLPEAYSKIAEGIVSLNKMAEMKETNKNEDYKRRRTDSLDTAEAGPSSRRILSRGDESNYTATGSLFNNQGSSSSNNSYRGNPTGWRGQPRYGGRGRNPRGAGGGHSYTDRRAGGY